MKKYPLNKITLKQLTEFLCVILIGLMFVSKISLKFIGVPRNFSFLIFQNGMHPFINFGLNFSIGAVLFFYFVKRKRLKNFKFIYVLLMLSMAAILTIQTLLQIAYVHPHNSVTLQMGGLIIALGVMLIYGIMMPDLFSTEKFVKAIRTFSVPLVVVSVLLLPVFNLHFFRGGRFIGVFKHIPHMVSASTFAYIFYFPELFNSKKPIVIRYLTILILLFAVFLTATKAAMVTVLMVTGMGMLTFGSKGKNSRIFKFLVVSLGGLFILLFGTQIFTFLYEVASGQVGFLMRPPQDGIATRMEEIYRGFKIFMQHPHLGQGILYKFMSRSGINVGGYNSFKDPHNIFVSAGVIGGWPYMIAIVTGFVLMIVGSIRGLFKGDINTKIIAIFLIAHIPVFVIYHVHLSLGGMGDRMYWMIFGYLGLKELNKSKILKNIKIS